jgi:hypothetical protein
MFCYSSRTIHNASQDRTGQDTGQDRTGKERIGQDRLDMWCHDPLVPNQGINATPRSSEKCQNAGPVHPGLKIQLFMLQYRQRQSAYNLLQQILILIIFILNFEDKALKNYY